MMAAFTWTLVLLCFTCLDAARPQWDCPPPPRNPNTKVSAKTARRPKFQDKDKVYYSCALDYTAAGGSRMVQCNKGVWTKLTLKCEKIPCGYAGDLPNGELHYQGSSVVGDKVYAICNKGYKLTTTVSMICQRTGWVGEFPKCEKGPVSCPPPNVPNSAPSPASEYQAGQSARFTCSPGFQLDGAAEIRCNQSGQWQPALPQCRPVKVETPKRTSPSDSGDHASFPGNCSAPLPGPHAHLADRYRGRDDFKHSERVHFVCAVGYAPEGGSRFRRCLDGQWTPLLLQCERKWCGSAGEVLNGRFNYSGIQFGDKATAACDPGYRLLGQATRHCMSFGWDGRVPTCEAVHCDEPPVVANTERSGPPEPPYSLGTSIRYHCRSGVIIGSQDIHCTANGTWSVAPKCKEITCLPPKVPDAIWTRADAKQYQYRDTLSIECRRGFTRIGPNSINCDQTGHWFPGLPKCRRRF